VFKKGDWVISEREESGNRPFKITEEPTPTTVYVEAHPIKSIRTFSVTDDFGKQHYMEELRLATEKDFISYLSTFDEDYEKLEQSREIFRAVFRSFLKESRPGIFPQD